MRSNMTRGIVALALGMAITAIAGLGGRTAAQAQSSGNSTPATTASSSSTGCDAQDSMCLYCQNNPSLDLCSVPGNGASVLGAAGGGSTTSSSTGSSSGDDQSMSEMGSGSGSMGSASISEPPTVPTGVSMANSASSVGVSWVMCTVGGEGLVWMPAGTSVPGEMC